MFALGRFNDTKVSDLVESIAPGSGPGAFLDSLVTPDFVSGSEFPFMADWTIDPPLSILTESRPPVQRMVSIDASLHDVNSSVAPNGTSRPKSSRAGSSRAHVPLSHELAGRTMVAPLRDQFLLVDDNVINQKVCLHGER